MADPLDITVAIAATPLDDQPLADKPAAGALAEAVASAATKDRPAVKATAHLDAIKALTTGGFKLQTSDGMTIVCEAGLTPAFDQDGNLAGVEARVTAYGVDGAVLAQAPDNIHRAFALPFLVPDGTCHEEPDPRDPKIVQRVENLREDPVAAMQRLWLIDSVRDAVRRAEGKL